MKPYFRFSDVLHFYKRNWIKFLLVVLLCGVLCALLPLKLHSMSSTVNTTIMLNCELPENASSDYRLQYNGIVSYRITSAVAQASSHDLIEKTTKRLGLQEGEILKITGEQQQGAPAVKLTLETTNADMAEKISDTAAEILCDELVQQYPSPKLTAFISDPAADMPETPKLATTIKAGVLGLVLGFILFVCYGFIRVLSRRSVCDGKKAAALLGVKCLGEIPHGDGKQADAFRRIRTVLLNQAEPANSLLIEGAKDGGTAQTAVGLAVSLSQAGRRVLAIDADLRNPQMAGLLGVSPTQNLRDVLAGRCTMAEAVAAVPNQDGLFLLAGAAGDENPADLLARSFPAVLKAAESKYDNIIICAPSQLDYPDADSIAACPQAVLLTAKYNVTSYKTMNRVLQRTAGVGGKTGGFIVMDA
ncbi:MULTISPECIES: polysaccharide biosynthesis tyrosine autokinase [Caproicibacterium]|jgi:Mrp family chromosome partitioning ATPase|uniref:AAA domain-containing protein n=1 Tax=Caproicibacterium lactatifermentans TaxID=2666138 RepID=A0A859DS44_9FIRM|nr:polysaccharide biosynthesis tyrosine autokinase [Caproicibacterium lactatifermentans]MDD4808328.1 hypothetical protein [Oscillospiraceae bacterium]QKN24640.1 hypothetical protein GJQ69_09235 [Caproicibacterium lactatifermentans]QKO30139.1 hypothetical protein GKP14_03390 [Caproicibacterium lactatifermentans]